MVYIHSEAEGFISSLRDKPQKVGKFCSLLNFWMPGEARGIPRRDFLFFALLPIISCSPFFQSTQLQQYLSLIGAYRELLFFVCVRGRGSGGLLLWGLLLWGLPLLGDLIGFLLGFIPCQAFWD